ncbi:hypothetical protein C8R46DRAFT_1124237 [Mycena filopes]|nr:hypothetical protein C8R46DRAFT_1124237 [Mycena filopes]
MAHQSIVYSLCEHTAEWDAACKEVMILTQILSTLPQESHAEAQAQKAHQYQEILSHLVQTLYYTPKHHLTEDASQVTVAAAISGVISVGGEGILIVCENISSKAGESHLYTAREVTRRTRTAEQVVADELLPADLNEHLADVLEALIAGDLVAAENLIAFRSLNWMRRRLHEDQRIFTALQLNPRHLLFVLAHMRRAPSEIVKLRLPSTSAPDALWELPPGITKENNVAQVPAAHILGQLQHGIKSVFDALESYESCRVKDDRKAKLRVFAVSLTRLNEISRHRVCETVFKLPAVEEAAASHIRPWQLSNDDDETGLDHRLGIRLLLFIKKLTQPIRSMQILLRSNLPRVLRTRALNVYTVVQQSQIPPILIQDLIAFRASFLRVVPPHERFALDPLILRAFFPRAALRPPDGDVEPRVEDCNALLRELDDLQVRDRQDWVSDSSVSAVSTTSTMTTCDNDSSPFEGSTPRHDTETPTGRIDPNAFLEVYEALEEARTSPICTTARHAEGLLMATLNFAPKKKAETDWACATRNRPCFACSAVSSSSIHDMTPPCVPPCGLPLAALVELRKALHEKFNAALKERGKGDTSESGGVHH